MSDAKDELRALGVALLFEALRVLGPALVRKKVDEWEVARGPSNAAFEAKFKERP